MPDTVAFAPLSLHRDQLLSLLAEAEAFPPQVKERLLWFVHVTETQSVSETCRRFGIARTTFYRWFDRFDPANLSTLTDQSVAPPAPQTTVAEELLRKLETPALPAGSASPAPWGAFLRRTLVLASVLLNVAVLSALAAVVAWESSGEPPVEPETLTASSLDLP